MHFEDIWEESERLSDEKDLSKVFNSLKEELNKLESLTDPMERAVTMGSVLFLLSTISKILNINVAAALKNAIENKKIDVYG